MSLILSMWKMTILPRRNPRSAQAEGFSVCLKNIEVYVAGAELEESWNYPVMEDMRGEKTDTKLLEP